MVRFVFMWILGVMTMESVLPLVIQLLAGHRKTVITLIAGGASSVHQRVTCKADNWSRRDPELCLKEECEQ